MAKALEANGLAELDSRCERSSSVSMFSVFTLGDFGGVEG